MRYLLYIRNLVLVSARRHLEHLITNGERSLAIDGIHIHTNPRSLDVISAFLEDGAIACVEHSRSLGKIALPPPLNPSFVAVNAETCIWTL